MSHTIYIQLNNKQIYVENCNDFLNKINQIEERIKNIDININLKDLIDQTNNLLSIIKNNNQLTQQQYLNFLKNLSTLEKEVTNNFMFVKNNLSDSFFENLLKNQEFNISDKIQQHGILANEVLQYLKENNLDIDEKNFNKYIEVVENRKLNQESLEKYIRESFEYIDSLKMNDELKYILKKDIRNINSLNQLKDVNAIIQTKEREYNNIMKLAKDTIFQLAKQGFQIDKNSKTIWQIDDQNNIVLKMGLINNQNNLVQIIFNSNLQIKYKLGNYIGHACEKTTEKLLKDLEQLGYTYSIIDIKRDYEDLKQMQASIDKERNK